MNSDTAPLTLTPTGVAVPPRVRLLKLQGVWTLIDWDDGTEIASGGDREALNAWAMANGAEMVGHDYTLWKGMDR